MTGWQKLWQDPEIAKLWSEFPPVPEVVTMADRLEAERRRRVLDIGCGMGRHTLYLAARGFEVTATDNAPAAITACQQNLAQAGLAATVMNLPMTEFPFPDGQFDGVVSSYVIHHADGPTLARIISLITQKLAPGGFFAWVTPSPRHGECGKGREIDPGTWVDENHAEGPVPHHYSTEEEVRRLLAAYDIESLFEEERRDRDNKIRWHWRVLARKR